VLLPFGCATADRGRQAIFGTAYFVRRGHVWAVQWGVTPFVIALSGVFVTLKWATAWQGSESHNHISVTRLKVAHWHELEEDAASTTISSRLETKQGTSDIRVWSSRFTLLRWCRRRGNVTQEVQFLVQILNDITSLLQKRTMYSITYAPCDCVTFATEQMSSASEERWRRGKVWLRWANQQDYTQKA